MRELTVQELLAAAQQESKGEARRGQGRHGGQGGRSVLLQTKELLDPVEIGKLRQRWDSPFEVTAGPTPTPLHCLSGCCAA